MLDRLELEGRDWKPVSTPISKKLVVVDMDDVPKAWTYFMHYTLDTNRSGSKLITMRALALYYLLNRHEVSVIHIISSDMDEMALS